MYYCISFRRQVINSHSLNGVGLNMTQLDDDTYYTLNTYRYMSVYLSWWLWKVTGSKAQWLNVWGCWQSIRNMKIFYELWRNPGERNHVDSFGIKWLHFRQMGKTFFFLQNACFWNALGFAFTKWRTNCYVARTHCSLGFGCQSTTFWENYTARHLFAMLSIFLNPVHGQGLDLF